MAFQLKLVLVQMSGELLDDIDSLSLSGFSNGFSLVDKSWMQAVSPEADGYVTETMTLHVNAATQDIIASNLSMLADKARQADEQYGAGDRRFVFLRSQTTYESNARQAHVKSIVVGKMDATAGDTFDQDERIMSLPIVVRRGPWETIVATEDSTSTISKLGGAYSLSAAIGGDMPARPQHVEVVSSTGTLEAWLGLRSARYGLASQYVPISGWASVAFTDGGNTGVDTTIVSDGTAYGGNRCNCSFATVPTWDLRARTNLKKISTIYWSELGGSHLVLVRAKVSDASTVCYVRLSTGGVFNYSTYLLSPHEPVKVASTDWRLYALGILDTTAYAGNFDVSGESVGIGLDAERVSGSGELHFDVLGLIPYAEGFFYLRTASTFTLSDGIFSPIGHQMVLDGAAVLGYSQMIPIAPGASRLIYFAQGAGGVGLSDSDQDIVLSCFPRWQMLRGAE